MVIFADESMSVACQFGRCEVCPERDEVEPDCDCECHIEDDDE